VDRSMAAAQPLTTPCLL